MYSVLLMAAVTGGAELPAWCGRRSRGDCCDYSYTSDSCCYGGYNSWNNGYSNNGWSNGWAGNRPGYGFGNPQNQMAWNGAPQFGQGFSAPGGAQAGVPGF